MLKDQDLSSVYDLLWGQIQALTSAICKILVILNATSLLSTAIAQSNNPHGKYYLKLLYEVESVFQCIRCLIKALK